MVTFTVVSGIHHLHMEGEMPPSPLHDTTDDSSSPEDEASTGSSSSEHTDSETNAAVKAIHSNSTTKKQRVGRARIRSQSSSSEDRSSDDENASEKEAESDVETVGPKLATNEQSSSEETDALSLKVKTSKYIGVDYNKHAKKFEARFMFEGRSHHIGLFTTDIEAAKAYDAAVFINRGPDAPRNFAYEGVPPIRRSSRFRGVNFDKRSKKWKATIRANGQSCYLGLFTSEVEAAMQYDKHALQNHGLKAVLNFPDAPHVEKTLAGQRATASKAKDHRRQSRTEVERNLEDDE